MANRYANLPGPSKIKDTYQLINTGFDGVEADMDAKPDKSIAQVNDVQMGTDDTLTVEGSTGITVTTNQQDKKVIITATGTSTPGPHGPSHNNDGADPIPDLQEVTQDLAAHKADKVTDPGGVHGLVLESGFWTPILKFGGENDSMVIDVQSGRYSRIGSIVTIFCNMRLSAKGISTGIATIEGLPYPNAGGLVTCALGEWTKIDLPTNYTVPSVRLDPSNNVVSLRRNGDDSFAANIDDTYLFDNTAIRFSFSYSI